MNMRKWGLMVAPAVAILGVVVSANADDFSFTGNFVHDNTVQLFDFTVGAASPDVILRTWSYAGGVNAEGQTIARGGFDPILALFNSTGTRIGQNDDGGAGLVAADALSGQHWDTYLDLGALAAGNYKVSVMQFDNFSLGTTLADGFSHDAPADVSFAGHFVDNSGSQRDSHWAFDILGVATATVPDGGSTMMLLGLAMSGLGLAKRYLSK